MPFTRPRHWLRWLIGGVAVPVRQCLRFRFRLGGHRGQLQNPSFAGFVTTQDHGLLEFLLVFSRP
jgi:hypothetical protein